MASAHLLLLILHLFVLHAHALTYRGVDLSSLLLVESRGVTFTDGYGAPEPFECILASHGCNTVRLRVWTGKDDYNTRYALKMAKRVKAAGMVLAVDLHFSSTWADMGHQAIPSSWPKTLPGLKAEIFNYTHDIVKQFAAQDTPIDILQVGNEINNGLLYPVGEISVNGVQPVSKLLHSAIHGAKAAGFCGKTLIHLANAWNWEDLSFFFSNVFTTDALVPSDVDLIGLSFYPFYEHGATFEALNSSLTRLATTYQKPILIVETDWPVACPNVSLSEPNIPISDAGQQIWVNGIKEILGALPNSLGEGIFYWEPAWVENANLGSSCADNLLVTPSGETRASINMFEYM